MIPTHRVPTHPGRILLEEFLVPMAISQTQLAAHLRVPMQRLNELINGKRGVTPDTAWLLAAAFSTSPDFWMNLQAQHDLAKHRPTRALAGIRARSGARPHATARRTAARPGVRAPAKHPRVARRLAAARRAG
jgi:antitoxin HigA-1